MTLAKVSAIGAMLMATSYMIFEDHGIALGEPTAIADVADDSGLAAEHSSSMTSLAQDSGAAVPDQVGDTIWECKVYFQPCGDPTHPACIYIGREPTRSQAEFEALNECKFANARRGRNCMPLACRQIRRPPPRP